MVASTVPDFFQEETVDALRCQVDWLAVEIGVSDSFFAKLLGTDETTFASWRMSADNLPVDGEKTLRLLWRAVLHLLSFLNFDETRVRDLFQQVIPLCPTGEESPVTPPWCGSNLAAYLERSRVGGIEKVEAWVTGLRFGDLYAV
jgi:hypothetical protein